MFETNVKIDTAQQQYVRRLQGTMYLVRTVLVSSICKGYRYVIRRT